MNILLIDDSATIRQVISATLLKMGHNVIEAEDGAEGLLLAQQQNPELVLLDVEMPGMNGFETAEGIREFCHQENIWIPIIFLSANMNDRLIDQGRLSGGDDFLMKPVSRPILSTRLTTIGHINSMRSQITQLTKDLSLANAKLEQLSSTDALTGTANRLQLDKQLDKYWQQCAEQQTHLTLLMVKIDHFALYASSHTHEQVDTCLKMVADLLKAQAYRSDTLIARTQSDQFALLLPKIDINAAIEQAEAIRSGVEALQLNHPKSPTAKYVTSSIGIAVSSPEVNQASNKIIDQANGALHDAQESGHNCALINPNSLI